MKCRRRRFPKNGPLSLYETTVLCAHGEERELRVPRQDADIVAGS